jgi:hypothetical protein
MCADFLLIIGFFSITATIFTAKNKSIDNLYYSMGIITSIFIFLISILIKNNKITKNIDAYMILFAGFSDLYGLFFYTNLVDDRVHSNNVYISIMFYA